MRSWLSISQRDIIYSLPSEKLETMFPMLKYGRYNVEPYRFFTVSKTGRVIRRKVSHEKVSNMFIYQAKYIDINIAPDYVIRSEIKKVLRKRGISRPGLLKMILG